MPNPLYTHIYIYIYIYIYKIYMIWFGWVLWHINHCWLLNAPNPLNTYILNEYMICKHIFRITFLNKHELILNGFKDLLSDHNCLHIVKCFKVLLYNNNNLKSVISLHTFE